MQEYLVEIMLKEPVCIATQHGVGNVIPTLQYIPGSALRGALADLWLQKHSKRNSDGKYRIESTKKTEFENLFLLDTVMYGNCTKDASRVIPKTALTCKHQKGFYNDDNAHGVRNILHQETRDCFTVSTTDLIYCPNSECGQLGTLDHFDGFYFQPTSGVFRKSKIARRFLARTRVSEYLERAQDGSLYTRIALCEGQMFRGKIRLNNGAQRKILEDLLSESEHIIFLGASKSRSVGRAEIKINPYLPQWHDEVETMSERLTEFQEAFDDIDGFFWSLTALSDLIIEDDYFRFKSWIDMTDIINFIHDACIETGVPENEIVQTINLLKCFELVRGWTSKNKTTGWNAAWGLPKYEQQAIAAGSVFLFYCKSLERFSEEPLEDCGKSESELFSQALTLLDTYGIGERRNEGFGQVIICDSFHMQEDW